MQTSALPVSAAFLAAAAQADPAQLTREDLALIARTLGLARFRDHAGRLVLIVPQIPHAFRN